MEFAAPLNQPLTAGDALWSDTGSRAEIDLGPAVVRIDARSSVALLDLSDRAIQLRLDAGSIDVTVNDASGTGAFEIDAPNAAVLLLRAGEYRLSVDNAGNTGVAVRSGQATVQSGDQQNMNLATGQRGVFGLNGSYAVAQAAAPDEFDRWSQQRQAHWMDDQAVAQYVSSDVVGYEDLNDYGQWQQEPDYGAVWFPTQVADDWAPYTTGHWAWVAPWGWSWVDDAPWGFAPFHYGRWGHVGRRWCWIPLPRHRHAVYAPALVAWVGGPGGGAAIALGGGTAVGWVPLGPGEVYVPASRVTRRYLQDINGNNSVQNRYINRDVPGALTVVPQSNFTARSAGRAASDRASARSFKPRISRRRALPGIAPERASVIGALSLNHVRTPPANCDRSPRDHAIGHRPRPRRRGFLNVRRPRLPPTAACRSTARNCGALRGPAPSTSSTHDDRGTGGSGDFPAPGATVYRGIPERSPQFQAAPQSVTTNVFQQRDREIQEQRRAQQQEQAAQETQIQQRAKQDRIQPDQPRHQAPPQGSQSFTPPPPPPQPQPPPQRRATTTRSAAARRPEPITPGQQR